MDQNFSIVSLVIGASTVVQLVLALLMAVSLASWTVIFRKYFAIKNARLKTDDFEQEFWSGTSLNDLYQAAINSARQGSPLQRIFASGMREFLKLRERRLDSTTLVDGSRRAMRAAFQREMDVMESNLSFLASVASVSPYVGLFGTVWGIMHAFVGLSNLQQVTLATVAPGIAEALVATAIGLFAAIPAVIAYNFFARDIDRLAIRFESFSEEFSNILQRQVAPHPQGVAPHDAGPMTRPMPADAGVR
jgi:biopolymer transport protein TolQ